MTWAGRKQLQANLLPLAIPGKDSFFATRLSALCCVPGVVSFVLGHIWKLFQQPRAELDLIDHTPSQQF